MAYDERITTCPNCVGFGDSHIDPLTGKMHDRRVFTCYLCNGLGSVMQEINFRPLTEREVDKFEVKAASTSRSIRG